MPDKEPHLPRKSPSGGWAYPYMCGIFPRRQLPTCQFPFGQCMGIDTVGIDEVGIDKVGIDEVGIDKVGINHMCTHTHKRQMTGPDVNLKLLL